MNRAMLILLSGSFFLCRSMGAMDKTQNNEKNEKKRKRFLSFGKTVSQKLRDKEKKEMEQKEVDWAKENFYIFKTSLSMEKYTKEEQDRIRGIERGKFLVWLENTKLYRVLKKIFSKHVDPVGGKKKSVLDSLDVSESIEESMDRLLEKGRERTSSFVKMRVEGGDDYWDEDDSDMVLEE